MKEKQKSLRLKELRLEMNLTQEDVAKVLNISRATYGHYEIGERMIPWDLLWILADFYKTSIDYIVGRVDL